MEYAANRWANNYMNMGMTPERAQGPHPAPWHQSPVVQAQIAAMRGGQKPAPTPVPPPQINPTVTYNTKPQAPAVAPPPSRGEAAVSPTTVPPESSSPTPPSPPSLSILDNPEAVESVLGMGENNRQMRYAEAMRDQAMPEGRYVSNGRLYVAGSPFEHLGVGYAKYKAGKRANQLGEKNMDAKRAIIEALRDKANKPEPPVKDRYLPGMGML